MSTSTQPPALLSAEQLGELLELTKQADSVELKMTVPDAERPLAVAALGMDPLDAQIRQVFFFDTADLALNQRGVVVRARRIRGRNDDSVVKVRPINPTELSTARKSAAELKAFLVQRGLEISGDQQTKTATALSYFAGEVTA